MFKQNITPKEAVDFLNSLLGLDREAITNLLFARVNCNKSLRLHPAVQVQTNPIDDSRVLGFLGIINGMFGKNDAGYGCIMVHLEPNDDEKQMIDKFIYDENLPHDQYKEGPTSCKME